MHGQQNVKKTNAWSKGTPLYTFNGTPIKNRALKDRSPSACPKPQWQD